MVKVVIHFKSGAVKRINDDAANNFVEWAQSFLIGEWAVGRDHAIRIDEIEWIDEEK